MASENRIFETSLPAAADLSASQYCAVICDTSGNAALPGAGVACIGVLQNKPAAAAQVAEVMVYGITKMLVGTGGLTKGDLVKVTTTGGGTTATSGTYAIGTALDTGVAGVLVRVLLLPQGKQ